MEINITQEATDNILLLQKEYDAVGKGLRFGLTKNGCSGYKYILEFEEKSNTDDTIVEIGEITIYISNSHFEKLDGSTIGWKDTLMESGFDIENPHATQPCGCGESINFKQENTNEI